MPSTTGCSRSRLRGGGDHQGPPAPLVGGLGVRHDPYILRLLPAQERERKWLAGQIHEDPLQTLSNICRFVTSATAEFPTSTSERS